MAEGVSARKVKYSTCIASIVRCNWGGGVMPVIDSLKAVSSGISVLGEVINAAGDNPDIKQAGNELCKSALTITKTINNALIPLATVNYAFAKARKYFEEKFLNELELKAKDIPPEDVVEPKASIAGPALQGLAFSHEESSLKEMYLSLLASALDGRVSEQVHPAFVEIIRQMDSKEARIIRGCLRSKSGIPIVEIRLENKVDVSWNLLLRHLLNLCKGPDRKPIEEPNLPAYVDNWIRLGLVSVDYKTHFFDEDLYNWVENRPEYQKLKTESEDPQYQIGYERGIMLRTAFGEQFANAVGLITQTSLDEP